MAPVSKHIGDFPDGPVVTNLPVDAGDTSLIPGLGTKIPHALAQLSLCAAIREATSMRSPLATIRDILCAAVKTQHSQK